jgi:hypothetical protein
VAGAYQFNDQYSPLQQVMWRTIAGWSPTVRPVKYSHDALCGLARQEVRVSARPGELQVREQGSSRRRNFKDAVERIDRR